MVSATELRAQTASAFKDRRKEYEEFMQKGVINYYVIYPMTKILQDVSHVYATFPVNHPLFFKGKNCNVDNGNAVGFVAIDMLDIMQKWKQKPHHSEKYTTYSI